jgi:hypothetical protein
MIFIEKDAPLPFDCIAEKLEALRAALNTGDDDEVRRALRQAVPTYKTPEEINSGAADSKEMKEVAVV